MQVPPCPNPTFSILNMLSEICSTLVDPRDPRSSDPNYIDWVKSFEGQLERTTPATLSPANITPKADMGTELYQLATRIYLVRATQSPWESPTSLEAITRSVFKGTVVTCHRCEHFFPLFILACEACRDDDRAAVLSLIEWTSRHSSRGARSLGFVRGAVQGVWVQQDLHAEGELVMVYVAVVSAVVSASNSIPSFVCGERPSGGQMTSRLDTGLPFHLRLLYFSSLLRCRKLVADASKIPVVSDAIYT